MAKKAVKKKEYICTKGCFHNKRYFKVGQRVLFGDDYPRDKKGSLNHFKRT